MPSMHAARYRALQRFQMKCLSKRQQPCLLQVLLHFKDLETMDILKAVVEDKCRLVVAAGGDGTVNVVVNAIMCLPAELRPRLAIIPIGTANDFAGTHSNCTACIAYGWIA